MIIPKFEMKLRVMAFFTAYDFAYRKRLYEDTPKEQNSTQLQGPIIIERNSSRISAFDTHSSFP
jgi:hypothetical protein